MVAGSILGQGCRFESYRCHLRDFIAKGRKGNLQKASASARGAAMNPSEVAPLAWIPLVEAPGVIPGHRLPCVEMGAKGEKWNGRCCSRQCVTSGGNPGTLGVVACCNGTARLPNGRVGLSAT